MTVPENAIPKTEIPEAGTPKMKTPEARMPSDVGGFRGTKIMMILAALGLPAAAPGTANAEGFGATIDMSAQIAALERAEAESDARLKESEKRLQVLRKGEEKRLTVKEMERMLAAMPE